jgi:hypothetical protein
MFSLCLFRITVDQYEKNSVLTIRKAERADTGKYRFVDFLLYAGEVEVSSFS